MTQTVIVWKIHYVYSSITNSMFTLAIESYDIATIKLDYM